MEINVLRTLNHQNIIKFYSVFQTKKEISIILEYIESGNLREKILFENFLDVEETKTMMKSILKSLEYIHEKNIMHRDIKLENILFRKAKIIEENILLADFGLATYSYSENYLFLKCGTPGYISPEIISLDIKNNHSIQYTTAVDIFSLGCVFHILYYNLLFIFFD